MSSFQNGCYEIPKLPLAQLKAQDLNQPRGHLYIQPKSERTQNKFRYERINNSYRLVQIQKSEQAYQDMNSELKGRKFMELENQINFLKSKIQRIEKKQDIELEIKQEVIKKLSLGLEEEKRRNLDRLENMNRKIEEIKCIANIQKMEIQQITVLIPNLRNMVKMQQINDLFYKQQEKNVKKTFDLVCLELKKSVEELKARLDQDNNQLKSSIFSAVNQKIEMFNKKNSLIADSFIAEYQHVREVYTEIENLKLKVSSKVQSHRNANQMIEFKQGPKCTHQILTYILLQLIDREAMQLRRKKNGQIVYKYGLDPQGYIVDEDGFYLLDKAGELLRLSKEKINNLKILGMVGKQLK